MEYRKKRLIAELSAHEILRTSRKRKVENTNRGDTKRIKCTSSSSGSMDVDIDSAYLYQLKRHKMTWELSSGDVYVVADCDPSSAKLKSQYCIVKRTLLFHNAENTLQTRLLTCSCKMGMQNEERLQATRPSSSSDCNFRRFIKDEESNYCLHAKAVNAIYTPHPVVTQQPLDESQIVVDQLTEDPFLAAVTINRDVHVLSVVHRNRARQLCCTSCRFGRSSCDHVEVYRTWSQQHSRTIPEDDESAASSTSTFSCMSYKPIPYSLPDEAKENFDQLRSGEISIPPVLIPEMPADDGPYALCCHGNKWDDGDAVEHKWCVGEATIYFESFSLKTTKGNIGSQNIKVFYRPSVGTCACKLYYDGRDDLLFNLNNKDIIHHSLLQSYLHLMCEGRNPLATFHRAYVKLHATYSTTVPLPLHKLRIAWNGYSRLLSINYTDSFTCVKCGETPPVIICDGTSLGVNKVLLKQFLSEEDSTATDEYPAMVGSKHEDRVYIPHAKARKLLLKFADQTSTVPLSSEDFTHLIHLLKQYEHLQSLVSVLLLISTNGTLLKAPQQFSSFFSDIAKNSPVCSLIQIPSNSIARNIIKEVIRGLNIFNVSNSAKLKSLQHDAPLIFKFLVAIASRSQQVPIQARQLLFDILIRAKQCYVSQDNNRQYPSVSSNDSLSFFPSLPHIRGKGRYKQDKTSQVESGCRKFHGGHPTLSPGIFTVCCPHKVCYGFQLMKQVESPAVPFSIIMTRFPTAPQIIIYDNCCKLHQYSLNREPEFFKNTLFLVDRLHWKNHTGCSSGYNMNVYKYNADINKLNSQVCEQSNADLARIKAQVSYMLPDNFMFHVSLFLAVMNRESGNCVM
ncbi:uncharacterized protein LOC144442507 [Glandiceps talaboti]